MTGPTPAPDPTADPRIGQLAERLAVVRSRIAAAARRAGRDPDTVTLIAVTKFFPAADVLRLAALGVTEVGENREQEAAVKHADVAGLAGLAGRTGVDGPGGAGLGGAGLGGAGRGGAGFGGPGRPGAGTADVEHLRWHMIGQLQTNKARAVLRWASSVQSVDRLRLVTALSRAAADTGRTVDCLVQVGLGASADGRGGADPDLVPELAAAVAAAAGLRLRGLMAVAPLGADPGPTMARLAGLHQRVRTDHPAATDLSAGMSGDLEAAVAAGATHVRIGSALLGQRPAPV